MDRFSVSCLCSFGSTLCVSVVCSQDYCSPSVLLSVWQYSVASGLLCVSVRCVARTTSAFCIVCAAVCLTVLICAVWSLCYVAVSVSPCTCLVPNTYPVELITGGYSVTGNMNIILLKPITVGYQILLSIHFNMNLKPKVYFYQVEIDCITLLHSLEC